MIWKSPRVVLLCSFFAIVSAAALTVNGCGGGGSAGEPGKVQDEAMRAGRDAKSFTPAPKIPDGEHFHPAVDDYFYAMDENADAKHQVHPLDLTLQEAQGRATWIVWTGGNDRLWDVLSRLSVGNLDLLKTISTHPKLKAGRHNRWAWMGLVNEPCFVNDGKPNPDRFGLYLDTRKTGPDCPAADPFEDETKYPGVRIGGRGKDLPDGTKYLPKDHKMPVGSFYGYATGVVGLRLFPNPDFDEKAAKRWDPERYYNDPKYYNDKDLVKPYRVGMSCGFCHVGPNPVKPPADPENPKWENLSSNVGAQYFWIDRIFTFENDHSSFAWQVFHTSRPGSLDTSLVSSDNINNPRTMNAVYQLLPRLLEARRAGKEILKGGDRDNKQLNDFADQPQYADLPQAERDLLKSFYIKDTQTVYTPRVLKDGADSVGALGALNRVYLNIGLFSEEWLLHFNALIGGKKVSPIEIAVARKNSVYWQATELQTMNMALFFLKSTAPHYLNDALKNVPPDERKKYEANPAKLKEGMRVFAERCARCHSSKLPALVDNKNPGACAGDSYLKCWSDYWELTTKEEFKTQMLKIVEDKDFLKDNYLSTEFRVPVTFLQTNACSPLATNAIKDNIWDNFSSGTYKELPAVGSIDVQDPITGNKKSYVMPGLTSDTKKAANEGAYEPNAGGRGFTRPASLVSLWSTAPFLLNNSVGRLYPEWEYNKNNYGKELENPPPTVEYRMDSFNDSIHKMLWPEDREKDEDPVFGANPDCLSGKSESGKALCKPNLVDRTTETSYLLVPAGYVPDELRGLLGISQRWFPSLFGEGGIRIGPIPKGTPVNLLANLDMEKVRSDPAALKLLLKVKHDLESLPPGDEKTREEAARQVFLNLVPDLLKYSKCPDFVVNRGHYFGTDFFPGEPGLKNEEKEALIEFLKTF